MFLYCTVQCTYQFVLSFIVLYAKFWCKFMYILPNLCGTLWFYMFICSVKAELPDHDLLIFTGPIDAYFSNKGLPKVS